MNGLADTVALVATAYDAFPYANLPFSQTRPSVLATVAALHGLEPADPRHARVLELACGAGANLLGIAAAHPGVRAVGVDLAAGAIGTALEDARRAGLDDVRFEVADIRELVDGRLGAFDYVIAHGLYSWADAPLREALLAACRAHLDRDGLAFVSYTAHPGGHLRLMLRDMAAWHARGVRAPGARAERVHELFGLLHALAGPNGEGEGEGESFYSGVLAQELRALTQGPPEMLVHDLMGPEYEPVWFADFAAAAQRHGLTHVADALPEASRRPRFSPAVAAFVEQAAGDDAVAREQYFDILLGRRFRQSLVCRSERRPAAGVDRAAIRRLQVAAAGDGEGPGGASPVLEAAIEALAQDAGAVAFEALRGRLDAPADELAGALLEGFDTDRIRFSLVDSPAVSAAGPHPCASRLARSQSAAGALLTTLHNQVVRLRDEPTAGLLKLLDGTRDREALARDFEALDRGPLSADALESALGQFARLGLLEA